MKRKWLSLVLVLCLLAGISGCGKGGGSESGQTAESADLPTESLSDDTSAPSFGYHDNDPNFVPYEAPPMHENEFHGTPAETAGEAVLDDSTIQDGYIGVSIKSNTLTRARVVYTPTEHQYDYYIPGDGSVVFLPLPWGDGEYKVWLCEKIEDGRYAVLKSGIYDVKMKTEFEAFLRPNLHVDYDKDSECVKKAEELASHCVDELEVIGAVFVYLKTHISYDVEKAKTIKEPYHADVDETLSSGKGICVDYAAVAAAMLRSQGIPTKLVYGDVSSDRLYHAWNMFYTEETGWITVTIKANEKWNRMDITLSVSGTSPEYIGDGSHYIDLHYF